MTTQQAQEVATRLGLSAWVAQATTAGAEPRDEAVMVKCVGFQSSDLPLAEAETWDEAMAQTLRIIFQA